MSNYIKKTKNPHTGEFEEAEWLDNHFGSGRYGVMFPNGRIYNASDWDWEFENEKA